MVRDLLLGGPLEGCQWVSVIASDVLFDCAPADGITSLMPVCKKVIGLVWDVDAAAQRNASLQAQQATGQAVHQLLGLLVAQMQADLAHPAAGVAAVEGDFHV